MSAVPVEPFYMPEEYLALERAAPTKSEYFNGRIYAMAGASREHNLLAGNLFAVLHSRLRERPCEVFMGDMRVRIAATDAFTYPDVVVACGDIRIQRDDHLDTLLNPVVIVEVLSPSTEAFDRGDKFAHYRRLESLQEYALVAQDRTRVEQFTRQGEQWLLTERAGLDAALELPAIQSAVPLREIYRRVEFPAETPPPPRPRAGPPPAGNRP
jgi:Uma2 family endonuclease